jgi:hypothetical protein
VSGETSAERSHQNCGQLRIHSWWWCWCTCSVFFCDLAKMAISTGIF